MKTQRTVLLSLSITAIMAGAAVWATARLGDRPVATHFGVDGPDRFAPAAVGLWAHPATALALTLLFALLPRIMPVNARLERSAGAYQTVWLSVLLILGVTEAAVIAQAVGGALPAPERLIPAAVGVLLVILGNLMGKIRYNYVIGVRTPWTLADERVWDRTHRFIGPWFMAWGLALVASALLAPEDLGGPAVARWVLIGGAVGMTGLSLVYSYLAAKRLGAA